MERIEQDTGPTYPMYYKQGLYGRPMTINDYMQQGFIDGVNEEDNGEPNYYSDLAQNTPPAPATNATAPAKTSNAQKAQDPKPAIKTVEAQSEEAKHKAEMDHTKKDVEDAVTKA